MWDADDIARSVRRYIGEPLISPPWRLRTERREVRDDERPVAVVQLGDGSITRARESLEQGEVETLYPVTVTCYPALSSDAREGRRAADQLRADLLRLILIGAIVRDGNGKDWAGPFRIPLWDWSDVTFDDPEPEDPLDVLWVSTGSTAARVIQDPEDPLRFTVVLEFRVTVEAPGRVKDPDAPVVTTMPGGFIP